MSKVTFIKKAKSVMLSQRDTVLTNEEAKKKHQTLAAFIVSSHYDITVEQAECLRLANGTLVIDVVKNATRSLVNTLACSPDFADAFYVQSKRVLKNNIWSPPTLL